MDAGGGQPAGKRTRFAFLTRPFICACLRVLFLGGKMAGERAAATEQKTGRSESFNSFFKVVIEASSLGLIVAFVASTWINQLVFASWGLSFRALASTSDVVMSGLTFFFIFSVPAVAVCGIVWILKGYFEEVNDATLRRWSPWAASLLLLGGMALLFVVDRLPRTSTAEVGALLIGQGLEFYGLYLALALGALVLHVLLRSLPAVAPPRPLIGDRQFRFTILIAIIAFAIGLGGITFNRMQVGYLDAYVPMPNAGIRCDAAKPQVLWIGTQFAVLGCPGTPYAGAVATDRLSAILPDTRYGIACRRASQLLRKCGYVLRRNIRLGPDVASPQRLPRSLREISDKNSSTPTEAR